MKYFAASVLLIVATVVAAQEIRNASESWQPMAPRDEIKPAFSFQEESGPKGTGVLTIRADNRDGARPRLPALDRVPPGFVPNAPAEFQIPNSEFLL